MKKMIAILMSLCLLCAACAAVADMEIPDWDSMPAVVLEDDETTVDEAAFEGEWVLQAAFAGTEYCDPETLAGTYDFNFMPFRIAEGKVLQDVQQENGEFVTSETPCVFDAGQLQGTNAAGRDFVFELLENGNIVYSEFFPAADDSMLCLSVFLVHPAE